MASRLKYAAPIEVELDPRRTFTPRQKALMFERAKGKCEMCGAKIRGAWVAGHYPVPHAHGGRTTLDNARVEGVECGCASETAKADTTTAAKAKRLAGKTGQQARRKRKGSTFKGPGFPQHLSKGFDGKVRRK